MRARATSTTLPALVCSVLAAATARAQCLDWADGFGQVAFSSEVLVAFDAGAGPELYAGGPFALIDGVAVNHVARWDGDAWQALGSGVDGLVSDMAVFDDGSGPALYVTGAFTIAGGIPANRVARWNGTSWSALGSGLDAAGHALFVHDDGSGLALYVGGQFTVAGGTVAAHVARWNGTSFAAVGGGTDGPVYVFQTHDEGAGPRLFMGGAFFFAGAAFAQNLARWDGATWSEVAGGVVNGPYPRVEALAVWDDGNGPALFVGGAFFNAGATSARNAARWNGSSWSALGSGTGNEVIAYATWDDGSGSALYAAGYFTTAGGVNARGTARWNGTSWSALAGTTTTSSPVLALLAHDFGAGRELFAGGPFTIGGGTSYGAARRTGGASGWVLLASGNGLDSSVGDLLVFDEGSGFGPGLYVAGAFSRAGGILANRVARWSGSSWSPLPGHAASTAFALAAFDDGSGAGARLYSGGFFCQRWDGGSWTSLGSFNPPPGIEALCVYDDPGPQPAQLFAAGSLLYSAFGNFNRIARTPGSGWSAVGTGFGGPASVDDLAVFDDGAGPRLFACGDFDQAGGAPASNIAAWNGTSWSAVGGGIGPVWATCMQVWDDGTGPALYVGGGFFSAGGQVVENLARWNGTSWSAVPGWSAFETIFALGVHDDGNGPALYVGGTSSVARWDGSTWTTIGTPNGWVNAFASFDDGTGPALYVGGSFTTVNGKPSAFIAKWGRCAPGAVFCAGDGQDPAITTACPCGNFGAQGRGCAWSQNPAGAHLSSAGTANPDTVVLTAEGMPATTLCIFLAGDGAIDGGLVFGDGVRCVDGLLVRMGIAQSSGGVAQYPIGAQLPVSVRGNTPVGSGLIGRYQTYFRTASPVYCPPEVFNVTNGLRVRW